MKAIIRVEKGPNSGTQYELGARSYRAVGRAGMGGVTIQISKDGHPALEPDDLARIEAHLGRRPSMVPRSDRLRLGAFSRGRDIRLDDEKVSRTHAMFFLDEDGPSVVDLDSTNGTRVNGSRVADADLNNGDIVHIGKTRFAITLVEE